MNVAQTMVALARRRQYAVAVVLLAPMSAPAYAPRPHLQPEAPPADLPIRWPVVGAVSSPFGHRRVPIPGASTEHAGVDIAANDGAPVQATADGHVSSVRVRSGYGLTIVLEHGDGLQTVYAHLSAAYVRRLEQVVQGEIIGAVGRSGLTTGAHLHYELRRNGGAVDPGLG